jgi:hypothetical protein
MRGDGVAVDALALLGEPLDEGGCIGDLAAALGQGLALLGGHQLRQILLVRHHQLEPFPQDAGTLLGGPGAPGGQRAIGRLDGAPRLAGAHLGDGAEALAVRRILDRNGAAAIGVDPRAVDIALLPEQLRIREFHGDVLYMGVVHRFARSYRRLPDLLTALSQIGRQRGKRQSLVARGEAPPLCHRLRSAARREDHLTTAPRIADLLKAPPRVINIGLPVFAEELQAASIAVVQLDWRPPVVDPRLRALLAKLS